MVQPKTAPYGSWKSPISADLIVADFVRLSEVMVDGEDVYWIEGRPQEGGRNVLMRCGGDGRTAEVKQLLAEVEALRQELLTGYPSPSVDECLKSIFLPGVRYELSPVVETISGMTALLEEDERIAAIDGADLYLEHLAQAAREAHVFTDTLSDLMAAMCGEITLSKTASSSG